MLGLSDFFEPLNFFNLIVFFAFLVSCEIIGFTLIKTLIGEIPNFLRGAIWLLGLGLVIFLYFLSHFFMPLAWPAIGVCLAILLIPSLLIYFRGKSWQSLIKFYQKNYLPLLLLLPVIPLIFIKSSLPPLIWDEMAYHYISPYSLFFEPAWKITNGFIENLPRLLETSYIALFSLTKTYAVSRLLHLSIFLTALITVYKFMKDYFGQTPALLSFALLLFHGENLLFRSTSGYIDVGTTSFVIIGFLCLISFFLENKIEVLLVSFAFWGMAAGSKYSSIIPLVALLILAFTLLVKNKLLQKKALKKYLIAPFLFFIMGGYWYLKNFLYTGNPVYPFLNAFFGCRFSSCPSIKFSDWTLSFSLANTQRIVLAVFANNKYLECLFFVSLFLCLFHFEKRIRKALLLIALFIFIEILLNAKITGYESRYFYHWQFLSVFLIVLPTALLPSYKKIVNKIYLVFTTILLIFTVHNSIILINEFYENEQEPEREIEVEYAMRKININQWIEKKFPRMKETIFWCDVNSSAEDLFVFDPQLTWTSSEGLFRVFMTNCRLTYITSEEQASVFLRGEKGLKWLASLAECDPEMSLPAEKNFLETITYLEAVNNDFICCSKMILPGLFALEE